MAFYDNEDYFIKITPEFLFDIYDVFKSEYAPWVYLMMKFQHNWAIENKPEQQFRIPIRPISRNFGVNPSTISRAVKELTEKGFFKKVKQYYKIVDEAFYKVEFKPEDLDKYKYKLKFPNFIKMYYSRFEDMYSTFYENIPEKYKSGKFLLKLLETNYFLQCTNKHCLNDKKEKVASGECVNSICKALNYDNRTAKDVLDILEYTNYIKLGGGKTKITTLNIYTELEPTSEKSCTSIKDISNFQNKLSEEDTPDSNTVFENGYESPFARLLKKNQEQNDELSKAQNVVNKPEWEFDNYDYKDEDVEYLNVA